MHRAKGLDDLFFVGGQPRLRRFDYVPPEVRQRRATYAVEPSILTHGAGTLAEVRGRVVDAIGDFVGRLHTNLGRALLISAAPGAGKSTAVAKSIRKHRIEARIVVGTKALAQELAEDHLYNLIVGRNHINCDRYDVVKRLGESGHRVEALACGTPFEPRCPFFRSCRYFAQFHAVGPRVAATEQLFNPTFLAGGELVVVDDAELPRALIERWTVTGAVLERAVSQLSERGDPALLSLLPILQHAERGPHRGLRLGSTRRHGRPIRPGHFRPRSISARAQPHP
jgi:hypothetical protein